MGRPSASQHKNNITFSANVARSAVRRASVAGKRFVDLLVRVLVTQGIHLSAVQRARNHVDETVSRTNNKKKNDPPRRLRHILSAKNKSKEKSAACSTGQYRDSPGGQTQAAAKPKRLRTGASSARKGRKVDSPVGECDSASSHQELASSSVSSRSRSTAIEHSSASPNPQVSISRSGPGQPDPVGGKGTNRVRKRASPSPTADRGEGGKVRGLRKTTAQSNSKRRRQEEGSGENPSGPDARQGLQSSPVFGKEDGSEETGMPVSYEEHPHPDKCDPRVLCMSDQDGMCAQTEFAPVPPLDQGDDDDPRFTPSMLLDDL